GDNKAGGNLSVTGTTGLTLNQSRLVTDKNLVLSSSGQIVQNGEVGGPRVSVGGAYLLVHRTGTE
ncbi:hypothetical protein F7F11_26435, partial [Escherichia coli]